MALLLLGVLEQLLVRKSLDGWCASLCDFDVSDQESGLSHRSVLEA